MTERQEHSAFIVFRQLKGDRREYRAKEQASVTSANRIGVVPDASRESVWAIARLASSPKR
jgi:hypothetical protein